MKKISILGMSVILLLAACSEGENTTLEQKISERDSLEALSTEISNKIVKLNSQIANLDSNLSKYAHNTYVKVMKVMPDSFADFVEVQGVVEANKNLLISPEIGGNITKIHVSEGDKVSKGQKLISIDAEMMRKSLKEVNTQLDLATKLYERQNNLWEENIGSEIQLLEAENRVNSLKDKMATLNSQLEKATIKAPESGYIEEVIPKEGEMAAPGMPVIRLINLDQVSVKGDISERYIGKIKEGDAATILLPSIGKEIKAKIHRVGRYINPNNRTFKIEAKVMSPPVEIKPNMLTVMKVVSMQSDSAILVPTTYVMADGSGKSYLFIAENNMAKKVWVETGAAEGNEVIITSGLKGGESVITKGARTITEGEEIEIVKD